MKISEKDNLDPADYVFAGFYNAPPFNAWFWTGWYDQKLADEIGVHIEFPGYICLGKGHIFASKNTYESLKIFLDSKLENHDCAFFDNLSRRIDQEAKKAMAWTDVISKNTDLSMGVEGIMTHFRRITFFWALGYFLGVVFEPMLHEKAYEVGIQPNEISNYVGQPKTPLQSRQSDIRSLCQLLRKEKLDNQILRSTDRVYDYIQRNENLLTAFSGHVKDYPWISLIGFLGERLTLRKLVEQVLAFKPKDNLSLEQKLEHTEFIQYASVAYNILYVNQIGAEYFPIFAEKSIHILDSIAEQLKITREDLLLVTPEEIFNEKSFYHDILEKIKKRKNRNIVMYLGADHEVHIIDDENVAIQLINEYIPETTKETGTFTIKGNTGNKGKARGTARIILSTYEQNKMQIGDVLVTSMTTPDFVPLMQKASAIVTDVGGLLSHAVIMSRELKKPCIVGTKIATQVLKDGDLMEVDADKGVIRILNRAIKI